MIGSYREVTMQFFDSIYKVFDKILELSRKPVLWFASIVAYFQGLAPISSFSPAHRAEFLVQQLEEKSSVPQDLSECASPSQSLLFSLSCLYSMQKFAYLGYKDCAQDQWNLLQGASIGRIKADQDARAQATLML